MRSLCPPRLSALEFRRLRKVTKRAGKGRRAGGAGEACMYEPPCLAEGGRNIWRSWKCKLTLIYYTQKNHLTVNAEGKCQLSKLRLWSV